MGEHMNPTTRMQIPINGDLLRDAVMGKGMSIRKASARMGYRENYLHNVIYFGWISPKGIDRLQDKLEIMPEEYVKPQETDRLHKIRKARQIPEKPQEEEWKRPERCKTCVYRGETPIGCEYILVTGKRRGCRAADCTKYEKGPKKDRRTEFVITHDEAWKGAAW